MIYNYEQVLRQVKFLLLLLLLLLLLMLLLLLLHLLLLLFQVVYSNQKPAYYLNRQFKIVCSELSERFTSNEYVQTVGLLLLQHLLLLQLLLLLLLLLLLQLLAHAVHNGFPYEANLTNYSIGISTDKSRLWGLQASCSNDLAARAW